MSGSFADSIRQEFHILSTFEWISIFLPLLIVGYVFYSSSTTNARTTAIPTDKERVLVVGASSGIGRAIALEYARRGAKVAIMGRRKVQLEAVKADWDAAAPDGNKALVIVGDFTDTDAILRARTAVEKEFGGLDTLVVAAGVSALQPLVTGVAGAKRDASGSFASSTTNKAGIQRAADVANKAIAGNYIGPLITAVTFLPMLETTSKHPAVVLISSAASVIPAPTRSIYCASKGAALLLYQSLAIEHPKVSFSNVIPATVQGDFRQSSVDGGQVVKSLKGALKPEYVADRCIKAADYREKVVWMPGYYRWGHLLYWFVPGFVESRARAKYNFKA